MTQKRGHLTSRIEKKSFELLGYAMTQTELRMLPYIGYVMVNNQRIEPNKINADERKILAKWRRLGHIEGGASGLAITKQFWDAIQELIFLGYVDLF